MSETWQKLFSIDIIFVLKKSMILTLIISDNCNACERAKKVLEKISNSYPHITTKVIHIDYYKGKNISITPALLINQHLFCYGDIDEDKLIKKIKWGMNAIY